MYLLFQEFCGSKPLEMSSFDNRPNKMKEYSSALPSERIKFQTLSLPCFNKYRELFYSLNGSLIVFYEDKEKFRQEPSKILYLKI